MIQSNKMLRNQSGEVKAMMSSQKVVNTKIISGVNAAGNSTRVVPMYVQKEVGEANDFISNLKI